MYGRIPRSLFTAFTNPAPGVSPERFREWYEDIHRVDSFELGLFSASSRYRARTPSRVDYLTLWEGDYRDLASALSRVRRGAEELKQQGRIHPVQEVIFTQFLFRSPVTPPPGQAPVHTLTSVQNDWRRPATGQSSADWWKEAVEGSGAPLDLFHSRHLYAHEEPERGAGKFLALLESDRQPEDVIAAWSGTGVAGVTPFGATTPIWVDPDAPPPAPEPTDDAPPARRSLHVVHWEPISDGVRSGG